MTEENKLFLKEKYKAIMTKVISVNKTTDVISDDNLFEFFIQNMIGGWEKVYKDFEIGLQQGNSIEEQLKMLETVVNVQQRLK